MRNWFFVITVLLAAGAGLAACSGDDSSSSPLQPSPLAPAPTGAGPAGFAGSPPAGADAARGRVAQLAPPPDGFNAYNARIEYVDGEVTVTFVPVDMSGMPRAAGAHRNRAVTIRHCPVEPHHVGQVCGKPVFQDSFAFMGSPSRTFTMSECSGWLIIEAAELSDDRYDGWRNAPLSCRTDGQGRAVASVDTDGNGWEASRFPEPEPTAGTRTPDQVQSIVDKAVFDAGGLKPGGDPVHVAGVEDLFEETVGSTSGDYSVGSSRPAVATAVITYTSRVAITPFRTGRATIEVVDRRSGAEAEFDVTVSTLTILNPGDRTYRQGETITPIPILYLSAATVPGGAVAVTVDVTVDVSGLPAGLTWSSSSSLVSGTVSADAAVRDYTVTVTVTANDGVNEVATTADFTITVLEAKRPQAPEPPTWILLADTLTASRGYTDTGGVKSTGPGPDADYWPLRWARYYYAEGDHCRVPVEGSPSTASWTIVQAYVAPPGYWDRGGYGSYCEIDYSGYWQANPAAPDENVELLDSADSDSVRFRDGAGNPIARVPWGYDDDSARMWTFRILRNSGETRLRLRCGGGGGGPLPPGRTGTTTWAYLHAHDVPLPPSCP